MGSLLATRSKWIEPHAVTRWPKRACSSPDHVERHAKHRYGSILELNFMPFGLVQFVWRGANNVSPQEFDCEPRINNLGSGAINVGRRPRLESMIVGLGGCSIASRASN